MTAAELKSIAYVMANLDRDTLEQAGILKRGQIGGSDWKRYNDEPLTFILKLPPEKLTVLAEIITSEMQH